MPSNEELIRKRYWVGVISILCLVSGGSLYLTGSNEGLAAALLRVGILLVAFWLAMPSRTRPAAWKGFSSTTVLLSAVAVAAFIRQLRPLIPFALVLIAIGWFVRPKVKK